MAKQVIRLTESRLRSLVEACVRETMEDMVEEGYGWDSLKSLTSDDMSDEKFPKMKEIGEFIKGEPSPKHDYYKLMYNQHKNGQIDNGDVPNTMGKHSYQYDADDYAAKSLYSEPGFKGKARRAAVAAGAIGKQALDKGKKAVKRGIDRMNRQKGSKTNAEDYGGFTL
jgi:hypothetical protein